MIFFNKRKRKFQKPRNTFSLKKNRKVKRKPKIDLKTPKYLSSRGRAKISVFFYYFLIAIFIALLIYAFLFSSIFQIREINIEGVSNVDFSLIEKETRQILDEKYFNYIPKDNFVVLPQIKLKKTLTQRFRNIEKLKIRRVLWGKITLEITEKEIQVIICTDDVCAPLDKEGIALESFPTRDLVRYGRKFEVLYNDSDKGVEFGQGVNSPQFVDFAKNLRKNLTQNNILIKDLFIPLPSASEIKAKSQEGWLVYFTTDDSLFNQVKALRLILNEEVEESQKVCIEYIDLRVKGKVYYKLYDDCETLKKTTKKD